MFVPPVVDRYVCSRAHCGIHRLLCTPAVLLLLIRVQSIWHLRWIRVNGNELKRSSILIHIYWLGCRPFVLVPRRNVLGVRPLHVVNGSFSIHRCASGRLTVVLVALVDVLISRSWMSRRCL